MKIFLASPLGFAESTRAFLGVLRTKLESLGYDVVDPWSSSTDLEEELRKADRLTDPQTRDQEFHRVSMRIAERNAQLLRSCGGVLAVLDGVDVDSGTASEIGFAFGLGDKVINGYRGDFRRSGENDGVEVNLQVQYWIERSGGRIVHSVEELNALFFSQKQ
ncbi:MAG: nucleoside 2-deoxyribosyltransferase [Candidatus Omnitrophota bacterium]